MNVSVLCRACMKDLEVKELHHVDDRAIKMYKYCTKIVFDEVSALPKHFCSECTIKIKSTFSFIRKAQTVNETLKKFILALNHPSNIINKSLTTEKSIETNQPATNINNNDDKEDPRTELEQALHYLGSKYDIESAIDDADEAVDMFFKNLEESALAGESTSDEKSEMDEINRIYNFVAPLLAEKSNEENLTDATSTLYQNMKTFTMEMHTEKSDTRKPDSKRSDTNRSDSKKSDSKRSDTKKRVKRDRDKDKTTKSKKNKPSTVTQNILGLNTDSSQNSVNNSAKMDLNMVILEPNLLAPYDKSAADPIAVSTLTNATKLSTANGSDFNLVDKANNCPMCGNTFSGDSSLQEHILLDHSEDREEYSEENITEAQYGTKQAPTKCDLCSKIFNSPAWYNKHLEREHNNRIFKCDVCNKVYISYSSWMEHKKIHAPHRNCVCPVCHKHFRKSSQLTEHMVIHNDDRPFPCDQCHKSFKLKAVLVKHKKTHEANRKKILCQYCGNSFLCERSLREHMVRHTGSLPFACTECSFRCQYKTTYQRHKLRHSLYRPHDCKHCRKAFYSSDDLNRHMRTHTGERPYKCPYCDRSFAEHNKRKAHMVNHHQLIFEDIPRLNRDGTPYVETPPYAGETTLPVCSEVFTFTVLPDEPDVGNPQGLAPQANPQIPLQVMPSRIQASESIPLDVLPPQALPHQKVTFQVIPDQEMPIEDLTPQEVALSLPSQPAHAMSIQDMPLLEMIPQEPMN